MCKGVRGRDWIQMTLVIILMALFGMLILVIQPPKVSAMLQEAAVPNGSQQVLNPIEGGMDQIASGETVDKLANSTELTNPADSVISEQSVPETTGIVDNTIDRIVDPVASQPVAEVPPLTVETAAGKLEAPAIKVDPKDVSKPIRSIRDTAVEPATVTKPLVDDMPDPEEVLAEIDLPKDENSNVDLPETVLSDEDLSNAQAGSVQKETVVIGIASATKNYSGASHKRTQSQDSPINPASKRPMPFPEQAINASQVTLASGAGGGQPAGSGSASPAGGWMALADTSADGNPNDSARKIFSGYLLGFDQWCQPPPEHPPMAHFFSQHFDD
ncbi:hypothetical protein SD71_03260 [Cohnella kolymensis]|uniref:Uncharacterized protein n=1 Tax=Cohnella kolymensis TaxID=1590652 RepID=A0ABR5A999_9BACL|nr:hypothetical protein [Cohnella kolymensis]KIL37631.1 hypothetical protein SD71_03260 [Cohnella kolymensis]